MSIAVSADPAAVIPSPWGEESRGVHAPPVVQALAYGFFWSVATDGASAIGGSRPWPRRTVRKSSTKKTLEANPIGEIASVFKEFIF